MMMSCTLIVNWIAKLCTAVKIYEVVHLRFLQFIIETFYFKINSQKMTFAQSCMILCNPVDCSPSGSLFLWGFFRQGSWSGLPFPPLGDLPHPGIEPMSLMSPALAGGFLPLVPPGRGTIKFIPFFQYV